LNPKQKKWAHAHFVQKQRLKVYPTRGQRSTHCQETKAGSPEAASKLAGNKIMSSAEGAKQRRPGQSREAAAALDWLKKKKALKGRHRLLHNNKKPVLPFQGSFRALPFLGLTPQALLHRAFSAQAREF
jgi:hypothetical protein